MELLANQIVIFHILYIVGITAESVSGTISAGCKNMDLFGVITIATITALGGGTVRDILLGYYPLTWVGNPIYIIITILASILTMVMFSHVVKLHKFFLIVDGLGLVTFAYLGSDIGYHVGIQSVTFMPLQIFGGAIIAILMAIITGVSGGVLRDILCNDIPLVFQSELYAIVAAIVGVLHTLVLVFKVDSLFSAIAIISIGFAIRLCAIFKNWHLPKIKYF